MFSLSLGNSSSKYLIIRRPESEAKRMCARSFIARGLILTVV